MEASEKGGLPLDGRGEPGLQRIDAERVRRTLRDDGSERGYARLALMLDTVLPRLVQETAKPEAD